MGAHPVGAATRRDGRRADLTRPQSHHAPSGPTIASTDTRRIVAS
jgi:hypothetical protein